MTRIEKNTPVTKQLEEMKGSVIREVRDHNKKKRPALTCSLVVLFFIVCFFVWIGWVTAATGLVKVPLLSQLAYDAPQPIRYVEPGTPVEVLVEETFMSELTARLQSGNGTLEDRSISLTISEESLTATLRSLIEKSGMTFFDTANAQVVLDAQRGVELFVPISNNSRASAITLLLDVGVANGDISVTPTDVHIGNLGIPHVLLTSVFNPLLIQQVEKINTVLTGYASVDSVTLQEGKMILLGELSVEIQ